MSVLRCPVCERNIDTDWHEMFEVKGYDDPVCLQCLADGDLDEPDPEMDEDDDL